MARTEDFNVQQLIEDLKGTCKTIEEFLPEGMEREDKISTWKNSYVPLGRQYAAPTYQQAFRFFREKYNLSGLPTSAGIFQLRNTKHLIIKIIIT